MPVVSVQLCASHYFWAYSRYKTVSESLQNKIKREIKHRPFKLSTDKRKNMSWLKGNIKDENFTKMSRDYHHKRIL